jgi:hypothetical protein
MCSKNNYVRRIVSVLVAVLFALLVLAASSMQAQSTAFTSHERFPDLSTIPPLTNGNHPMTLLLYDRTACDKPEI